MKHHMKNKSKMDTVKRQARKAEKKYGLGSEQALNLWAKFDQLRETGR